MKVKLPGAFLPLIETRARFKAYYSGRGCAKSTSFAIAAILLATQRPLRILCAREVQKTIKESVKYDLEKAIGWLGFNDIFLVTANTIACNNGSYFMFEGMQAVTATKLQSLSDVDIVWVEEAQSISARSLRTLIPTIRKDGSEIWFSWNPYSQRDPVDNMFRSSSIADDPVPDEVTASGVSLKELYDKWAVVQRVTRKDNPMFPAVSKADMERDRQRDPDLYRHVWEGEYSYRSDAAVFKNWKIGTMEVPDTARPYYGADWGFSVDPTVLVRCYVLPDLRILYVDAEVGGVGIDIDKTPAFFDGLAEGPDDPLHPRKWPIMADSSHPQTISYMQQHGYPQIERAAKGPGSILEGVEFIKTFDVVINPNCKRVIDEFTYYSYERDKQTEEVLPKFEDDHNHTIDAVRYAVESIRRTLTVYGGFGVVSTQRENFGDFGREDMTNPVLSPKRPDKSTGAVKGLVW